MIVDYARSKQSLKVLIGREAFATMASVLLYPLGVRKRKRRTPRIAEQRTVVFVHGYMANRSCFLPLATYLGLSGYKNQLSFEYNAKAGIEQTAIQLKKFLQKNVRGGRIDLVCHSLGGLIARVYLQDLNGARRVDNCITLGTPHSGTYNAYWLWSRVGRELRPDSSLLTRLQSSRDKIQNVQFLSIVAGADTIVIPRVFAKMEYETRHIPDLGHLGLLFSPRVFRIVADALKKSRSAKSIESSPLASMRCEM